MSHLYCLWGIPRAERGSTDSEARGHKWNEVKQVAGEVGHGILNTANAIAPLVADGLQIAQAWRRNNIAREDAAYE